MRRSESALTDEGSSAVRNLNSSTDNFTGKTRQTLRRNKPSICLGNFHLFGVAAKQVCRGIAGRKMLGRTGIVTSGYYESC
ncbi:hypothetical protein E2C01_068471 [Portunus trituberculatus]|uniref:Uncharacterized protein n=1 Tax=Portunus trituberculatus TaxID=210409 RepID=A0A5B7HVY2_PORTR|nr:hypothetical protein [Portunus trituberculatus]